MLGRVIDALTCTRGNARFRGTRTEAGVLRFVGLVVAGRSVLRAYREAFDLEWPNGPIEISELRRNAREFSCDIDIRGRIAGALAALTEISPLAGSHAHRLVLQQALAEINDVVEWDETGQTQFTASRDLPEGTRAALQEVEVYDDGRLKKVKLTPKIPAIVALAQIQRRLGTRQDDGPARAPVIFNLHFESRPAGLDALERSQAIEVQSDDAVGSDAQRAIVAVNPFMF